MCNRSNDEQMWNEMYERMSPAERILAENGITEASVLRVWYDSGNDIDAIYFRQEDELMIYLNGPITLDRWHEITKQV